MQIKRDGVRNARPYLEGSIVHLCTSAGRSNIYVNTEKFITVDFYVFDRDRAEWYFYLDETEVAWNDLSDDMKLIVRTAGRNYWGRELLGHSLGEYSDDRYYVLETLSGS